MGTQQNLVKIERNERFFKNSLWVAATAVCLVLVGVFVTLFGQSFLSLTTFGSSFLVTGVWDPVREVFGAWSFLVGTLLTSVLALLISLPFSFALAICLGHYVKEGFVASVLNSTIDLLAGIPSVIYGFWGLFVLVPLVRQFELWIGVTSSGVGIFTASLVLAVMIIPYSATMSREVIGLVPDDLKEAALSLGATPYEVVKTVVIPYSKSGIFAGVLMSFGRAISETMAVTMLIGNVNKTPLSIFRPANTLASVIANEFAETSAPLHLSSLIELALVLFFVTALFSLAGRFIIKKWVVPV